MSPEWRTAVQAAVDRIMAGFEERYGYPPGSNRIGAPDGRSHPGLPADLLRLYTVVGYVSLPDVGNGLFVHGAAQVAQAYANGEVRRGTGRHEADVIVFGSDGGGTRYALASPTGAPVYRLPPGVIIDGVYESDDPGFSIIAADLAGFLGRLLHAVEQFAETGEVAAF